MLDKTTSQPEQRRTADIIAEKVAEIRQTRYAENDCLNEAVQTLIINALYDVQTKSE